MAIYILIGEKDFILVIDKYESKRKNIKEISVTASLG